MGRWGHRGHRPLGRSVFSACSMQFSVCGDSFSDRDSEWNVAAERSSWNRSGPSNGGDSPREPVGTAVSASGAFVSHGAAPTHRGDSKKAPNKPQRLGPKHQILETKRPTPAVVTSNVTITNVGQNLKSQRLLHFVDSGHLGPGTRGRSVPFSCCPASTLTSGSSSLVSMRPNSLTK